MRRFATALATVALMMLATLPACSGDDGPSAGEAQLDVDGVALVTSGDQRDKVTDSRTVAFGDKIEVTEGTARLRLPGCIAMSRLVQADPL